MTNTREKMNVRKLHFFFKFQISSLALGFLLQSPGVRLDVLTPIYTAISSGVGVWKCILRVSVFMLILVRTPSLPNMACTQPRCPLFPWVLFALFLACERCLCVTGGLLIYSAAPLPAAVSLALSENSCFPPEFQKKLLKIHIENGLREGRELPKNGAQNHNKGRSQATTRWPGHWQPHRCPAERVARPLWSWTAPRVTMGVSS